MSGDFFYVPRLAGFRGIGAFGIAFRDGGRSLTGFCRGLERFPSGETLLKSGPTSGLYRFRVCVVRGVDGLLYRFLVGKSPCGYERGFAGLESGLYGGLFLVENGDERGFAGFDERLHAGEIRNVLAVVAVFTPVMTGGHGSSGGRSGCGGAGGRSASRSGARGSSTGRRGTRLSRARSGNSRRSGSGRGRSGGSFVGVRAQSGGKSDGDGESRS